MTEGSKDEAQPLAAGTPDRPNAMLMSVDAPVEENEKGQMCLDDGFLDPIPRRLLRNIVVQQFDDSAVLFNR